MILHIDMDAFYASVEERDRPELCGLPLVVGGSPQGRGVVAAANYAARKYGVRSAMPAARAARLCPDLIFLPARHVYYAEVSRAIRSIFQRYTPLVEPLALDEAFLDVTHSRKLFGTAAEIGRHIKSDIKNELQLTASVGVATTKFVAKVASDMDKPDGFVVVPPGTEQEFLDALPVSKLWGVGRVMQGELDALGIATIRDLRRVPCQRVVRLFGKSGERIWQLAHGVDKRRVVPDHEGKSISHETTFDEDIADPEFLREWLLELTEQVARRLRRNRLKGRTVSIKIRFADFKTITRARTLPRPTDITQELWRVGSALLAKDPIGGDRGIRLLGLAVTGLGTGDSTQPDLFGDRTGDKQGKIDAVSDAVRERFGEAALRRATGLKCGRRA